MKTRAELGVAAAGLPVHRLNPRGRREKLTIGSMSCPWLETTYPGRLELLP